MLDFGKIVLVKKGESIITPTKTEKGIRRVFVPDFYADKIKAYLESLQLNESDHIFPFAKYAVVVLPAV